MNNHFNNVDEIGDFDEVGDEDLYPDRPDADDLEESDPYDELLDDDSWFLCDMDFGDRG